jgi:hypothetical protein
MQCFPNCLLGEYFWLRKVPTDPHILVHANTVSTKNGSVQKLVGPAPSWGGGVSRQNIRRKIKIWMDKQHLARYRGLGSTQRQARELISGPSPLLMFFNKTQSRVVTGLLTRHNTLIRHFT